MLVYDLKGHQQSVWAVLAIDEQQFLTGMLASNFCRCGSLISCNTGSADKTIKLWQQHKVLRTFSGHQDAVRGLALVPDIGFASCSNDRYVFWYSIPLWIIYNQRSEIRVWTLGGDLIYTLSGHTSFVYSLSVLPNGDVVSGGEDRSVRVWKGESLHFTFPPIFCANQPH